MAILAAPAAAASGKRIKEYPVGPGESDPADVAIALDGGVWFTEFNGNKVGRLDPRTGEVDRYPIHVAYGSPSEIIAASDGMLWFVEESYDAIGRVDPSTGTITEWGSGRPGGDYFGIAEGSDGNIWFTEHGRNRVTRSVYVSETELSWTHYRPPTPKSRPREIVSGADGKLWFTERRGVASIDPASGAIKEYGFGKRARPWAIASGSDGTLWVGDDGRDRLISFKPARPRARAKYPIDRLGLGIGGLAVTERGIVWFTERSRARIGRLNPRRGRIVEFRTPGRLTWPEGITAGPGAVWYAAFDSPGTIGRIRLGHRG